jgi:hypothetical protein
MEKQTLRFDSLIDAVAIQKAFDELGYTTTIFNHSDYNHDLDVWPPGPKPVECKPRYEHGLADDDILSAVWGYDQTNWDFYRVEKATKKMVSIVKLGKDNTPRLDKCGTDSMTGTCVPTAEEFGVPVRLKVHSGFQDQAYVKVNGHLAKRWDGKPKEYSTYG